ncbi:hypothetical protein ES703_94106 [subsurface metagenome]
MAESERTAESLRDKLRRQKPRPHIAARQQDATRDINLQGMAVHLADTRVQTVQRRTMARRIGQVLGSRHLHRLVTFMRPSRAMSPTARVDMIQRFDAYEHAQIAEQAGPGGVTIKGVQLTLGDINALGDLYETVDDLLNADPNELRQLVALIRKQKADPESVTDADWERATAGRPEGKRYIDLARKNAPHYGPSNPAMVPPQAGTAAGQDHRAQWEAYHRRALGLAQQAANTSDESEKQQLMDKATTINAFGDHFLADAFASGHLFNKDDVMNLARKQVTQLKPAELTELFNVVATRVFAQHKDTISKYEVKGGPLAGIWWPNLNSASRFSSLLAGIFEQEPNVVYGAIVKAVHDHLNKQGFEVSNTKAKWTLVGDLELASSPHTQKWLQTAIQQTRANLTDASQPNQCIDFNAQVAFVTQYVPEPTKESAAKVKEMIQKMTDPKGGMATELTAVINQTLPTILQTLVRMGKIRLA